MNATLPQKAVTEAIGTFFLMLTVLLAVAHAGELAPIAIGIGLMGLVYAGGHISKAHYNPAVTLAFLLLKQMTGREAGVYVAAQVGAATAAALLLPAVSVTMPEPAALDLTAALIGELLFTFALVWLILNVAIAEGTDGNDFYGIAIGAIVLAGAYAVGPLSGAAFNPAVAIGATVGGLLDASRLWVYLLACPLGAVGAAAVFRFATPSAHAQETAGDAH